MTVYVISSISRKYRYIGMSSQFKERLARHNKGQNKTTKPYAPFQVMHIKEFENRVEARKYEKYLKSGIGREFLNKLEQTSVDED